MTVYSSSASSIDAASPGGTALEFAKIEAEQVARHNALAFSMIKAQIRNAISELEDGDVDEAIATLKNIVGDDV
jgi:hypothetical protein